MGILLLESHCNIVAEYNALHIGIMIALELDIYNVKAYVDLLCIINQVRGEFEV